MCTAALGNTLLSFYAFAIFMSKPNYDDITVHKNYTYDISIDT